MDLSSSTLVRWWHPVRQPAIQNSQLIFPWIMKKGQKRSNARQKWISREKSSTEVPPNWFERHFYTSTCFLHVPTMFSGLELHLSDQYKTIVLDFHFYILLPCTCIRALSSYISSWPTQSQLTSTSKFCDRIFWHPISAT